MCGDGLLTDFQLYGKWDKDEWKQKLVHKMDANHRVISVRNSVNGEWVEFNISAFYGNCGLCIISNLNHSSKYLGKLGLEYATYVCEQMGYSQALYSVYTEQKPMISLLEEFKFKELSESNMLNMRSDNYITIYSKALNPSIQEDDWEDEENDY